MTAVEWLIKELNQKIDFIPMNKWDEIRDLIQQALEMEKQQQVTKCDQMATNSSQPVTDSHALEISDEQIETLRLKHFKENGIWSENSEWFIKGAKWYREQLKQRTGS
jgi:hypothetical protein